MRLNKATEKEREVTMKDQPHSPSSGASFERRHIGPNAQEQAQMLETLGLRTMDELMDQTIPEEIQNRKALNLPSPLSEPQVLQRAKELGAQNKIFTSLIGMGYYPTHTPMVIQRCVLENPGWYTAYTPYQPEISQGRLEALINFQTMVQDLTGMEIANASLLDEGTAIAEAVTMAFQIQRKKRDKIFLLIPLFPQSVAVLKTRCEPLGIQIETGESLPEDINAYCAVVSQYPNGLGSVKDFETYQKTIQASEALSIVAADILSLCLLKPPGEMGTDIVVGSTQRFGVPMGFGGPHAAYLATKDQYKRLIPGRIVSVSKDSKERPAYRLALQTREQHIRREKATSNICTAQVLLAVIAGMYGVYHGPKGLRALALSVHRKALRLAGSLNQSGYELVSSAFFDTLFVKATPNEIQMIQKEALKASLNLNYFVEGKVGLSVDETTTEEHLLEVARIFALAKGVNPPPCLEELPPELGGLEQSSLRTSKYLSHPVFNRFHSETELMRYMKCLEKKDLTLTDSMIPLGSCTMKLNGATELAPISWPEFAHLHPFCPMDQAQGSLTLIQELREYLAEITGFADISLQPNAGSQGEFAGLLSIRKYHEYRGNKERHICLIPRSAHGTNPASAVMAGMKVVIVDCDDQGNIDLVDLLEKAQAHRNSLAALMITYPSTHGVFEAEVKKICEIIHDHGGQVYMDGANLNAMVGLCQPGQFGPDVCHLNLHKTFCIPHGGGGPGVGPIGVAEHLKPFMPGHNLNEWAGPQTGPPQYQCGSLGECLNPSHSLGFYFHDGGPRGEAFKPSGHSQCQLCGQTIGKLLPHSLYRGFRKGGP